MISRQQSAIPAPVADPTPEPPAPRSERCHSALARCYRAAVAPFAALNRAGSRLGGRWLAIVTSIQHSARVRATLSGLRSCARRYGWPAEPRGAPASAMNSVTDFVNWIAGYADGAGGRGTSRAQLVALQRHWSHVFVTCGRRTAATRERLQSAQRAVFLREHHRQVLAVEALARAVIARRLIAMKQRLGIAAGPCDRSR